MKLKLVSSFKEKTKIHTNNDNTDKDIHYHNTRKKFLHDHGLDRKHSNTSSTVNNNTTSKDTTAPIILSPLTPNLNKQQRDIKIKKANSFTNVQNINNNLRTPSIVSDFMPKINNVILLTKTFKLFDDNSHTHNYNQFIKNNNPTLPLHHTNQNILKDSVSLLKTTKDDQLQEMKSLDSLKRLPDIVSPNSIIGPDEFSSINRVSKRIYRILDADENTKPPSDATENKSDFFIKKYGKPVSTIGEGSYGVTRLFSRSLITIDEFGSKKTHTYNDGKTIYFAIKEFTIPKNYKNKKKFATKITSEFIIGSTLNKKYSIDYPNLESPFPYVFDLLVLPNNKRKFLQVMEFLPSTDLFSNIKYNNIFHPLEADCLFKQILSAVHFMHSHGVAHCDIKPENILLNSDGLIKLCDFGTSFVFQTAWENNSHLQSGIRGSQPYVAPEEFLKIKNITTTTSTSKETTPISNTTLSTSSKPKYKYREYDTKSVDSWACGIVYCNMVLPLGTLWNSAIMKKDLKFKDYIKQLSTNGKYSLFEKLPHVSDHLQKYRKIALYGLLNVDSTQRWTIEKVLESAWMKNTFCCFNQQLT